MAFQPTVKLHGAVGETGHLQTQTWHEVTSLAFTDSRAARGLVMTGDTGHRAHWSWEFPAMALHSSAACGELTVHAKDCAHGLRQRTELHVQFTAPTSATGVQACGIGNKRHGCMLVYRQDTKGVNHMEVWLFRNFAQVVFPMTEWDAAATHLSQWREGKALHAEPLRVRFDVEWPHWCTISIMDNATLRLQRVLQLGGNRFPDGFVLYSHSLPAMAHVGQAASSSADVVLRVMSLSVWQASETIQRHGLPSALHQVVTVTPECTVAMHLRNGGVGQSGIDTAWGTKQRLVEDMVVRATTVWVTPHKRGNVIMTRVFRNLDMMWTGHHAPTWSDVSSVGQVSTVQEADRVPNNLHLTMTTTALDGCTPCCLVLKALPGIIRSATSWTVRIHKGPQRSDIQETTQLVSVQAFEVATAHASTPLPQAEGRPVALTVNRLHRTPQKGDLVELLNGHLLLCQSTNDANMCLDMRDSNVWLQHGETLSVVLNSLAGSMKVGVCGNWEEL